MAEAAAGGPPASAGGLAVFFVRTLPESVLFGLQKVATALHWPLATPYTTSAPGVNALFALLVTVTTVVGLVSWWRLRDRVGWRRPVTDWALLALAVGTVASLVSSATEARFAVLLVLLGVAGCALAIDGQRGADAARRLRWAPATAVGVGVCVVFAIGVSGLAHPADVGVRVTPTSCADEVG